MEQNARKIRSLIDIQERAPTNAASTHAINISSEEIKIEVGGANGFTLHTPHGYVGWSPKTSLHHDIMLGIGLALDWHGHSIEAAQIISLFWRESRLAQGLHTAFPIALCLARANQLHPALEIAEALCEDASSVDAAQIYLLPFFSRQIGRLNVERDFGIRVVSRIAHSLEQRGNNVQASMLNYNCANMLREMSRFQEAVHYYRNAARLDEAYLQRPYFWSELAGVLFQARRYSFSARFYRRSLDIEENRLTKALYADALMFAGHYAMAEKFFDEILEQPVQPDDAEWALKGFALDLLLRVTGLDEQRRKTPIFPESFDPKNLKHSEIENVCRTALQKDALSGLAWFNLGGIKHKAGDNETAARCFLLAALAVPWDIEAWDNVIALAMGFGNADLFGLALVTAYSINGDAFLSRVTSRAKGDRAEFTNLLTTAVQTLPERSDETVLKMHGPGAAWDYFEFTAG